MMSKRLENKVAIVTGAGRGVGQGVAIAMAKEGTHVAVVDMNAENAQNTAQGLRELGVEAIGIACDVSDQEQVKNTIDTVIAKWGTVDILVNNAQASRVKTFEEMTADDVHLAYSTGTLSTFFFMKGVLFYMKEKGYGKIINFGSGAAIDGQYGQAAYAAAKEGVRAFTRVAAREWGAYGINVNLICPFANSPGMIAWSKEEPQMYEASLAKLPIKRIGDCEKDIGRTAVFLASRDSDYITGQTIMVDGGGVMVR
ncbi:SDR family NAD(P)-dependent oxidoreductase [Brevibacillus reuszeri]|uniref:SDR family NAD(P)-dependent oxidoreductase n=1 Tax=Brevibacillus reuszeri TaxID=54915 RepID=UPI0028980838|nr:SDR family NAD(P)-dependent oxidoreductase [Brevibacillus reuszeri]